MTSRRVHAPLMANKPTPEMQDVEFFARAFMRRAEAPKQTPDVEYHFRHLRREGTPDDIPTIPTLAEALVV